MTSYFLSIKPAGEGVSFVVHRTDDEHALVDERHWHRWQLGDKNLQEVTVRVGEAGFRLCDLEEMLGPQGATLALLSLFSAAENEFHGRDWQGSVVQPPDESVFGFMEEAYDLLLILQMKTRMKTE